MLILVRKIFFYSPIITNQMFFFYFILNYVLGELKKKRKKVSFTVTSKAIKIIIVSLELE